MKVFHLFCYFFLFPCTLKALVIPFITISCLFQFHSWRMKKERKSNICIHSKPVAFKSTSNTIDFLPIKKQTIGERRRMLLGREAVEWKTFKQLLIIRREAGGNKGIFPHFAVYRIERCCGVVKLHPRLSLLLPFCAPFFCRSQHIWIGDSWEYTNKKCINLFLVSTVQV